jgi:hypothetical protein
MSYDWVGSSENKNSSTMDDGFHLVRVVKVIHGRKDGSLFTSRNDDPQIMVVIENSNEDQAVMMFTLSSKAGWTLARFLSCAGADLVKMNDDGVVPLGFTDEPFAKIQLMDRELWVLVESRTGKKYPDITPYYERDIAPEKIAAARADQTSEAGPDPQERLEDGDIPF